MTEESPGNNSAPSPSEDPSRPVWLQGLIGILLALGLLALMWYLFRHLL